MSFPSVQQQFVAETGLDFSFIVLLYEGGSGQPATANDVAAYAQELNLPFPVLADANGTFVGATPLAGNTHPELCAVAPDMTILSCTTGHNGYQGMLDSIRQHAGLL